MLPSSGSSSPRRGAVPENVDVLYREVELGFERLVEIVCSVAVGELTYATRISCQVWNKN